MTRSTRAHVRRPMAIVLAALTAVAMMVFPGAPAGAVTVDAHCLGGFSRNFSPAITVTPQTVTVSGTYDYGTCLVGATATGSESVTLSLGCVPVTAGPAFTETVTWHDATGGTSTIDWAAPTIAGQTVVYTGTVTAGRHAGDTATKVTSGTSYLGSVVGCLLGTPISDTTGLVDSFLLTH